MKNHILIEIKLLRLKKKLNKWAELQNWIHLKKESETRNSFRTGKQRMEKKKLHKKISEGKVEGRKTNIKHSPQLKIYMYLQKERTQGVLK